MVNVFGRLAVRWTNFIGDNPTFLEDIAGAIALLSFLAFWVWAVPTYL